MSLPARILDGKEAARKVREELRERVRRLASAGRPPRLEVVLVGEDPASEVYVRNKARAARGIGIEAATHRLPRTVSQDELEELVRRVGRDPSVDALLVQLPLPEGLDPERVVRCIPPGKDVDGLHPENVGELARGTPRFVPCTPLGVVELLARHGLRTAGRRVVVVGRSNLVGRPLASLLLLRGDRGDATVTIAHSRTRGLAEVVRAADIVVAAVGRPRTITAGMVREGAVVVDVGINRIEDPAVEKGYRLVGDVDFDAVREVASWIAPVPGGVGPMTVAMLLANTVQAAEAKESAASVVRSG